MAEELGVYYQVLGHDWTGKEVFVDVFPSDIDAINEFAQLGKNPAVQRATLVYFDNDYCKTIGAWDRYGLKEGTHA